MPIIIDNRLKFPCCNCNRKQGRGARTSTVHSLPFPPQSLIGCSIDRSVAVAVHILYIFALSEFALNSGVK